MIPLCILVIEDDSDRDFMTELYLSYHRLMYREIFKLLQDRWATEDVMQTTLVKLIGRISHLRGLDREHLVNYMIFASKNQARNYLRDSIRHETESLDSATDNEKGSDEEAVERHIIRKEELERLSHIWPMLDERSRYLLEGRYILGLSCEEMAKELNIKAASVRMALTRARNSAYDLLNSMEQAP